MGDKDVAREKLLSPCCTGDDVRIPYSSEDYQVEGRSNLIRQPELTKKMPVVSAVS